MKKSEFQKSLSPTQREELLAVVGKRFAKNMSRHEGMAWAEVVERMEASPGKVWSLHEMESTGGEPDVIGRDDSTGEFLIVDCSAESPKGRTSLCYDREGLESRKEHRPKDSAIDMAKAMGVALLTEDQYRALQVLGEFDKKTSSWVMTPTEIRQLGGALFGDRRFGRVFIYHNGAQSYYGVRGFRGMLRV